MKYFVIFLFLIGFIGSAFAYSSEELFYGSSSFEKIPTSVIPGSLTEFEIKFRYTTGPYALSNFSTVIEISPASASSKVHVDVEPIEGISYRQVVRIPVTITVDPGIEHEKIFLSVYFTGEHFSSSSDVFFKSAWTDSATINIESLPILGLSLLTNTPQHASPLKQFKSGISIDEIQCKQNFTLVIKHNGSPACVKPTSVEKLIERGWGIMPEQNISETPEPIISNVIDPTKIVNANNQFAIDFYSQVTADKEENVFFSPWSITNAFAIAYEGARGNTANEMSDAFGFVKDDEERRNAFAAIHEDLNQKDARYKLSVANALWLAPDFEPFKEYVNTAKTYYDSEVETVNLVGDGVDIINDWVKTKTEDKIEEILVPGSLTVQTRMVITNAIYFNGTWVMPFDVADTREEDFIVNAKKTVTVPMMSQTLFFNYTDNEQLQILELPYEGDRLSMLILLPNKMDGMKSLEKSLTAQKISQWKNDLFEMKLQVQMPKFIMETDYDLIPGLKNLGINDAFGPADFTGISNSGLYIDKAIHKAFVDVNEKGTEAAAVTAIVMDESGSPSFRADHPFIFIIQDNETGIILFIGKVVDPTA